MICENLKQNQLMLLNNKAENYQDIIFRLKPLDGHPQKYSSS